MPSPIEQKLGIIGFQVYCGACNAYVVNPANKTSVFPEEAQAENFFRIHLKQAHGKSENVPGNIKPVTKT